MQENKQGCRMFCFAYYSPDKNYPKLHKTIQTRQRITGKEAKDLHLKAQRRIRVLKYMKGKDLLSRQGYSAGAFPWDMIWDMPIISWTSQWRWIKYDMNIILDPSQGDNTNVFQAQTFTREKKASQKVMHVLLLDVKQPYPDKQKAWVENGGTVWGLEIRTNWEQKSHNKETQ